MITLSRSAATSGLLRPQRCHPTIIRSLSATATRRSDAGTSNPTEYCRNLVQKHDYEGYLTSQLYPRQYQSAYYALRAFYIELSMVRESVSQTALGQARFVFWRDAVKGVFADKPPRHPIALGLYEAAQRGRLAPYHFHRIIDAREQELVAPPHLTMESMAAHAEATASTFLYLLLGLLDLRSATLAHAASHLGVAQTITTLLRAFAFHAGRGRMVIPAEITARHGVRQQEVFERGGTSAALEDAVFEFAAAAHEQLATARGMFGATEGRVPRGAMPVFANAVAVGRVLERLAETGFDVYGLRGRDGKLAWRVWRGYYTRRF